MSFLLDTLYLSTDALRPRTVRSQGFGGYRFRSGIASQ